MTRILLFAKISCCFGFLLLSFPIQAAETPKPANKINLAKEARIFASHATPGDEFKIENAIDGDPETKWVGEAHPLSFQPANIVLQFARPETVNRITLLSTIFRDRLALKDVEVYGWAEDGNGWDGASPLAISIATNVNTTINFPPTTTSRLRLRITDTWRDDHSYPRVHEIEVFRADPATSSLKLKTSPIPKEKGSEQFVLRRAMGEKYIAPGTNYDPAKGYLYYARACLDTLISEGTDVYGPVQSPMFASLLDMETHRIPEDIPANIEGQRYGDRSLHGGNLMHDIMLLRACDLLTQTTDDPKYRQASTEYLRFFLKNCPQPTGLFPWGEHSYWDFTQEKPGHPTHEFLGGIPSQFWQQLWEINSAAVRAEASGLINHVTDFETYHFDRHADLFKSMPEPRPKGGGGLDFPRHAGFYIHLWAFAFEKTKDQKYANWVTNLIEHHWRARNEYGILPSTTRGSQSQTATVESTLSLAVSLLESAALLPSGALKDRCQNAGEAYANAVLQLPHRPSEGKFVTSFGIKTNPREKAEFGEPFRYGYGGGFTCDNASLLLAVHRLTGNKKAFELAEAFAAFYAQTNPPPAHEIVRTHVYASIIGLFTDLYALKKKSEHLQQAERYAQTAISRLFYKGLLRGATAINHYEGDLMPGNLVYNLLWLHSVKHQSAPPIPPNYFNR